MVKVRQTLDGTLTLFLPQLHHKAPFIPSHSILCVQAHTQSQHTVESTIPGNPVL